MTPATVTVFSRKLRDDGLVVVDRTYDRSTKRHHYEVLVCSCGGAKIDDRRLDTTDKAFALACAQGVAAKWA